jgi:hypothetical protein
MLLEGGFVVANGAAEGFAALESEMEVGESGLDDVFFDEGPGGVEASVEIEGGDDGFESVRQERGFFAAAGLFFATPEAQEGAEIDAGGYLAEMTAADERGAEAGEFALAGGWEAAEESFGDGEAEDSVSDELELLVVGGWVGEGLGVGLVGERTVGEGPGEEIRALEEVVEQGRGGIVRLGSSGLLMARRHGTPLLYFTGRRRLRTGGSRLVCAG